MEPSAKYVTNTTQDYGGGAIIDLTKEIKNDLYVLDDAVDRTICYTSPAFTFYSLAHINECIDVFDSQIDTENSYGTIQASIYSRTLKDWTRTAPSTDVWSGYAICNVSTPNRYFWGYGGSAVRGDISQARYGKSIDFNHMVFPMGNVEVIDKSVYDGIDYDTYPTSQYGSASTPTTHNINLKTLDDNAGDYFVNSFTLNAAYIWQPNNNTWVGTNLRPSLLIDGDDAGGAVALENPFLGFTGGLRMTAESQNGHVSKTGGGDSNKVYKNLNDGLTTHYCLGFTDNFTIRQTRFSNFDDMNNWGQAKYIELYGLTTGTHKLYFEHQEIDLGDSILCLQFNIEMKYSGWWVPPHVYCDFQVYMKGSTVSKYLACMGLYVTYDGSAPTGLTPLTLHTSDKVWLGEMNESGNTTGNWIKGIEIFNYTGYNKIGNTSNPDYDPSKSGGGGDDDDPWDGIDFGGTGAGGGGAFCSVYYMTGAQLTSLKNWSNTSAPEGFDMLPSIIGLQQLPVAVTGAPTTVKFLKSGAITSQGESRVIDTQVPAGTGTGQPISFSLGSIDISRRMQQRGEPYLDYDSTIELFLPFAGTFVLDTQAVMGRTISAEIVIDPVNGTAFAYAWVSQNGQKMPIAYGSSSIAVDLPIASNQWGISRAAFKQISHQMTMNAIKDIGNFMIGLGTFKTGQSGAIADRSGFASLSIQEGLQAKQIGGQMMTSSTINAATDTASSIVNAHQLNNTNYTAVNGSFGGSYAEWSQPFTAYVRITRPKFKKPPNFNHTQAVPCVETKKLSACVGLTICINPDCGAIPCTEAEKIMITQALVGGVYAGR